MYTILPLYWNLLLLFITTILRHCTVTTNRVQDCVEGRLEELVNKSLINPILKCFLRIRKNNCSYWRCLGL